MFPNAHGVSSTTMQTPTPGEERCFEIDLHLSELLAYTKRFEPASGWWRSILAASGQPERFT
jgi:hypothetical protein